MKVTLSIHVSTILPLCSTLFEHLKISGICGKTWRLIKQWYTNTGRYSAPFTLHRGVRQGSVLSPFLFLLVMDPILLQLRSKSCGLSITGLYLGAFSHADDVRTLSTSIADACDQINQVQNFASSRGLVLNANKCEAIVSPSTPASLTSIDVDGLSIPVNNSAICLGS